jgi:hypothetical protein
MKKSNILAISLIGIGGLIYLTSKEEKLTQIDISQGNTLSNKGLGSGLAVIGIALLVIEKLK